MNNSTSFKYKSRFIGKTSDVFGGNRVFKNVKVAVPRKYFSNFWRSLEMPLINFKIHLELNWSKDCVIFNVDRVTKFKIPSCTFQLLLYEAKTM